MSLSCPRCGNSIEQDFGVITCSKCAAVLFIDMEGQVQLSGEEGPSDSAEIAAPVMAEPAADFEGFNETAATVVAPRHEEREEPTSTSEYSLEAPVRQELEFADAMSEPEIGATAGTMPEIVASSDLNSNSLSEVSEFGNSSRDYGALSYTVLIEHIDTSEIRKKLSDALSDSKFQWDVGEILQKIEMGRLELTELNPAKASILVRRLQDVPVTVSWNQKLL